MNENVIVTGSSRGIGLAIAEAFFKAGCNVLINCSKSEEAASAETARLNAAARGNAACCYIADVSDYESCEAMIRFARENLGKISILVNNAAIASYGLFTDMTPSAYKRLLDVNLLSAMNMSHLALPEMVSEKKGCIINISSIWGNRGASCEAVYAASKAGLEGFTKSLAKEYGPSGIRVNAIACGVIDTQINNNLTPDEKDELRGRIPEGRFGAPEEIAQTALFLASDAAGYISGAVIAADGAF